MIKTPNSSDISDITWILERLKRAEDFCDPYFENAKRHYRLYRYSSSVNSGEYPYVNMVRSRDILAFVEDTTALLIQTLFATLPFFSVIPRETTVMNELYGGIDAYQIGYQLEKVLDYQISHEDTEFFEEIVDFFKGGCMFGNSYIGVYPKFQKDGTYLRPLLKTVDFWDALPVGDARRMTKSRGVFIREFNDIEELKDMQDMGIYKNVDMIPEGTSTASDPKANWHKQLLQDLGFTDFQPHDENIETFHYFSGGHVITFGNRKIILRDSRKKERGEILKPYPYDLPIVQYKYMPVPLEFFAMGIPEVLEVLQEDKNLIRSARRDNIDHIINKIVKVRTGGDVNLDLINWYPGAKWPLSNLKDVEVLETGDVTSSSYNEEGLLQKDMENALSLFGYARGMTPQHSEQPTTVMKLQQASLNRMDLAVKMAEFTTLQNIASRVILLTRKYMDKAMYEAIIGEADAGFYSLPVEAIKRFYYVKPVGSSVTHIKELRQQQIQYAIDMLAKIPPQMMEMNRTPFEVDWYEALRTAFDAVDVKNIDRIIVRKQKQQQQQSPYGMGMGPGIGGNFANEIEELMKVQYGGV